MRSCSSVNPGAGVMAGGSPVRLAITSDFQASAPESTSSAHNRPLPQAGPTQTEGSGAPKMTTFTGRLKNQNQGIHTLAIVPDEAMPGDDGLPLKFCRSAGCGGTGNRQTRVPVLASTA